MVKGKLIFLRQMKMVLLPFSLSVALAPPPWLPLFHSSGILWLLEHFHHILSSLRILALAIAPAKRSLPPDTFCLAHSPRIFPDSPAGPPHPLPHLSSRPSIFLSFALLSLLSPILPLRSSLNSLTVFLPHQKLYSREYFYLFGIWKNLNEHLLKL